MDKVELSKAQTSELTGGKIKRLKVEVASSLKGGNFFV
jgi:hypothetical protein